MSSIAEWSYKNVATVWPAFGDDEYGRPSFGAPYAIACTWIDTGETQMEDTGSEFVPASTYWFEAEYGAADLPKRGDYIAKFDQTGEADPLAIEADVIRKVTSYDMQMFGAETPDWAVYT